MDTEREKETGFRRELAGLLNRYSKENASNTQDFVLMQYICDCLDAFNNAVNHREILTNGHKSSI